MPTKAPPPIRRNIDQVPRASTTKGFILVATSIALAILLALAALGIDVARMYVIKSELQAFADSAALSAALQLDGTSHSIAQARAAAEKLATGPHAMKWDMGTQPIAAVELRFAKNAAEKAWETEPRDVSEVRYVRVAASAPAPLIFLRAFDRWTDFQTVTASSVAMKSAQSARLVQ